MMTPKLAAALIVLGILVLRGSSAEAANGRYLSWKELIAAQSDPEMTPKLTFEFPRPLRFGNYVLGRTISGVLIDHRPSGKITRREWGGSGHELLVRLPMGDSTGKCKASPAEFGKTRPETIPVRENCTASTGAVLGDIQLTFGSGGTDRACYLKIQVGPWTTIDRSATQSCAVAPGAGMRRANGSPQPSAIEAR